jgi:hypothetical protein
MRLFYLRCGAHSPVRRGADPTPRPGTDRAATKFSQTAALSERDGPMTAR